MTVILAATFLTTQGAGSDNGGGNPPGDDPPGDGGNPPVDDLSTLFTPEEVTAKKESIAAARAEEERRAALTEEQRAEEDRVKTEEAAKNQVPEEYADFTVPDGVELDKELLTTEFEPFARELGLTQEKAQKLVDMGSKIVERMTTQMHDAHAERVAGWLETAKADAELKADIALGEKSEAARALNTIATPELKAYLNETGLGNHPEMIRMFLRIAPSMREDGLERGGAGSGLNGVEGVTGSIFNHPSRKQG